MNSWPVTVYSCLPRLQSLELGVLALVPSSSFREGQSRHSKERRSQDLGLPIIVVVFSDSSLSLIRVSQQRRAFPNYGVDFPAPDFAAIAQAFGIPARRAESLAAVRTEIERALISHGPVVLEVPVDLGEYYDLV